MEAFYCITPLIFLGNPTLMVSGGESLQPILPLQNSAECLEHMNRLFSFPLLVVLELCRRSSRAASQCC